MSSTTQLLADAVASTDETGQDKHRRRRIGIDVCLAVETGAVTVTIVWCRDDVMRSIAVPVGELDGALRRIAGGQDFQTGMVVK